MEFEALTDEEIANVIKQSLGKESAGLKDYNWMVTQQDRDLCQAQLSKDKSTHQQEIREIFGELPKIFYPMLSTQSKQYNALKTKYGGQA